MAVGKLAAILAVPRYRRAAAALGLGYLGLFAIAMQDVSLGGRGVEVLTVEWTRMFERTGAVSFESVARLTLPGLTILVSPLNLAIGSALAVLAAANLLVTWIAFRYPRACGFNRATGILASMPALLAGSACCAPAIVLVFGLQVSSLFLSTFRVLIPLSLVLLVASLKLILDRTDVALVADVGTVEPAVRFVRVTRRALEGGRNGEGIGCGGRGHRDAR